MGKQLCHQVRAGPGPTCRQRKFGASYCLGLPATPFLEACFYPTMLSMQLGGDQAVTDSKHVGRHRGESPLGGRAAIPTCTHRGSWWPAPFWFCFVLGLGHPQNLEKLAAASGPLSWCLSCRDALQHGCLHPFCRVLGFTHLPLHRHISCMCRSYCHQRVTCAVTRLAQPTADFSLAVSDSAPDGKGGISVMHLCWEAGCVPSPTLGRVLPAQLVDDLK